MFDKDDKFGAALKIVIFVSFAVAGITYFVKEEYITALWVGIALMYYVDSLINKRLSRIYEELSVIESEAADMWREMFWEQVAENTRKDS
jgi:hypothetical protein